MGKRQYDEHDKERAFQALALHSGSSRAASKELRRAGYRIPTSTIEGWRKRDPDRYERTREVVQARIISNVAEDWTRLTRQSIQASEKAVEKAEQATREDKSQEANRWSGTAQRLATVSGIGDDKTARAQGRPTAIVGTSDVNDIQRKLIALGVLEVEAEDVEVRELPPQRSDPAAETTRPQSKGDSEENYQAGKGSETGGAA